MPSPETNPSDRRRLYVHRPRDHLVPLVVRRVRVDYDRRILYRSTVDALGRKQDVILRRAFILNETQIRLIPLDAIRTLRVAHPGVRLALNRSAALVGTVPHSVQIAVFHNAGRIEAALLPRSVSLEHHVTEPGPVHHQLDAVLLFQKTGRR